ncbi:MAG: MerR family transcriptional regulator [Parafilimonas terrae]|nr:MerR family transcriptional regulator [Parafilimonas terrae]
MALRAGTAEHRPATGNSRGDGCRRRDTVRPLPARAWPGLAPSRATPIPGRAGWRPAAFPGVLAAADHGGTSRGERPSTRPGEFQGWTWAATARSEADARRRVRNGFLVRRAGTVSPRPPRSRPLPLSIGALSGRTGVKVVTIRYYEQIGLLLSPDRTDSRQRRYSDADVVRLLFIRRARELGFDVHAIREFLAFATADAMPDAERVRWHLDDVQSKIADLETLRRELCGLQAGNAVGRARIVGALAEAAGTVRSNATDGEA